MGEAIVFTSGKGGVGKTTAIANIGAGLSLLDKKVIMLDTDMGLRNLDMVMGLENHIHYHLMDILEERCLVPVVWYGPIHRRLRKVFAIVKLVFLQRERNTEFPCPIMIMEEWSICAGQKGSQLMRSNIRKMLQWP